MERRAVREAHALGETTHYAPPAALLRMGRNVGVPEIHHVPEFLDPSRAEHLFHCALATADWQRERVVLFGRQHRVPRLTAWYGEPGAVYRYGGVTRRAAPWPAFLHELAKEVSARVDRRFNFVLVNRYRNGNDMLGWHADDEADLGSRPVIASLSVGAERMFRVRARGGGASVGLQLAPGSLLLMWGRSQQNYKHCAPRTAKAVGERINFTFRWTRSA